MQVNAKDAGFIAVGAAFAMLVFYVAYVNAGGGKQPRYEESNPNLGYVIDHLDTGSHYFHPNYCVPGQKVVFLPQRYPTTGGPNLTALIHHGMDAMRKPAPQDDDWREDAPSEMAW
jgi:hypothetical protein